MSDATANDENLVARIGEKPLLDLAASFYRRVATDDLLGQMSPAGDLPAAEQRLAAFLVQRFGGPAHYSAARGHPRLRMRHAPFRIDRSGRDRWMKLMREAIAEQDLTADNVAVLDRYFDESATFMINQP